MHVLLFQLISTNTFFFKRPRKIQMSHNGHLEKDGIDTSSVELHVLFVWAAGC